MYAYVPYLGPIRRLLGASPRAASPCRSTPGISCWALCETSLKSGVAPQPAEHSPPPGRGLLIVATTSGEAGKRDQGRTKVNFARPGQIEG